MPCDGRRLATYASAALVSTAALFWLQPAQVVPPTTEQLRKEPLVTSVFAHTCSETCRALGGDIRCRAKCKRAKRDAARQARQRVALGLPGGAPELPSSRAARHANATAVCRAGGLLRVRAWAGRLGNALLQVANCLSLAVAVDAGAGCACALPGGGPDAVLNVSRLGRLAAPRHHHRARGARPVFEDSFWDVSRMRDDADARAKVLKMLRSASAVTPAAHDYDVHVHVRSGDIFAVHDQTHYAPPPVSYYADAIDAHPDWRRLRILAEDDRNPVVGALLRRYAGRADWDKQSLSADVAAVIGARRIVYGQGTFVPALLMLNPRLLEHYVRIDYAATDPHLDYTPAFDVWPRSQDYFRAVFPWRATKKQRRLLAVWPECGKRAHDCEAGAPGAMSVRCRRAGGGKLSGKACWKRVRHKP